MNWCKGLLRLWVVGAAIWIVGFVAFGDQYFEGRFAGPVAQAVQAAELYEEYWYPHILRPDLVAKKRQLLSEFYDLKSPHYCVSHEQREREKDSLAELEAKEAAKKAEAQAKAEKAKAQQALSQLLRDLRRPKPVAEKPMEPVKEPSAVGDGRKTDGQEDRQLSLADLERLFIMRIPECSSEVDKARSELEDVIDWDDIPDWARDALLSLAWWLFGPPIAVLVVGTSLIWAFRWALRGFRAG